VLVTVPKGLHCAEQFANDDTPSSSILKALKRSMAAEFSRELGEKVFRGKSRLAQMGFWVGGPPGYGFRGLMVSSDGRPKQKLSRGECKSLTTDRIILVPGPRKEIKCVRHMFSMVIEGRHGCTAIARDLNSRGIEFSGKRWTHTEVFNILTNPKYMGCNVWHRSSQRLHGKRIHEKPDQWIRKPLAFAPIIDQHSFDYVQTALPRNADFLWSDKEILSRLRRLLKAKGRLTETLIKKARGMPSTNTLHNHFGSYRQMYEMVGYHLPAEDMFKSEQLERTMGLRRRLVVQIKEMFPNNATVTHLPNHSRSILRLDDHVMVSILLCRTKRRNGGRLHWVVEPNHAEREYITLVCKLNRSHDRICSYYLFPRMNGITSHRSFKNDPWLAGGIRLKDLSEFPTALKTIREIRLCGFDELTSLPPS